MKLFEETKKRVFWVKVEYGLDSSREEVANIEIWIKMVIHTGEVRMLKKLDQNERTWESRGSWLTNTFIGSGLDFLDKV